MWEHRGKVAVAGVGHSPVFRNDDGTLERSLGALAVDSVLKAVADAGLHLRDIDGVITAPHQPFEGAGSQEGISEVTSTYLVKTLRDRGLDSVQWTDDANVMVGHALIKAIDAVAAERCKCALVVRALHNPRGVRYGHGGANVQEAIGGRGQFTTIYGLVLPSAFAHLYQRYLWKYGQHRDKMATFAIHNRKYGLMNENSFWKQNSPYPLTRDEYLCGRMISDPLSINDCDIPVQASAAFVVTSADRAKSLQQPPAYVLGYSLLANPGRSVTLRLEDEEQNAAEAARRLWESSGLGSKDVDVAQLYDGFLCITPLYTEGAGFCKRGEFLDFIQGGRIESTSEFPMNTSGGNNGCGRTHGVQHFYESVLQVQGRASQRQVPDANIAIGMVAPIGTTQSIMFGRFPS